ncbi:MAG: excinuclease ABC subunit UvrB, partial [Acidobacteria bacterium]|nr:excinuclease ABC subunit UvrB [Acidobacteriota bacterium]
IMYADVVTDSMRTALGEMDRRRQLQQEYNHRHGITPASIIKDIDNVLSSIYERDYAEVPLVRERAAPFRTREERAAHVAELERDMHAAAANLEFERAAELRDRIRGLRQQDLGLETVAPNSDGADKV